MTPDFAIIDYAPEPDYMSKLILILSKAYGLHVCYFGLFDFEPDSTPCVKQATFWNGENFENFSLDHLPPLCETRFSCNRAAQYQPVQRSMETIFNKTVLTEYGGLAKLVLSRVIQNSAELSKYAIPTFDLHSYDEFLNYARLLKKCIVKPAGGRQGKYVYRIANSDGNVYFLRDNENVLVTQAFWDEYTAKLREAKLGIPILQPRLNFCYEGRTVDFRLLVQRGGTGEWEKVAIYARIGESDTVSNLAQGGFVADPMTVLSSIAPGQEEALYQELEYLCDAVPRLIQSAKEKPLACLGIDVGIDCDTLQPYIIEANTYPGTKYHTWNLAHKKVQYFKYLIHNQNTATRNEA